MPFNASSNATTLPCLKRPRPGIFECDLFGDNMKSEALAADRYKTESRPSNRRRRMAKPTANGGDSAPDCVSPRQLSVVAAMHDHISCTKSADLLKTTTSQEAREEKITLPCELDHMYANCGEPKHSPEEPPQMKKLRELLLLHLDLIQQQEEQLRAKDRQLATMKQEKEALKLKLERMEKQVAILKQKEKLMSDQQQETVSLSQSQSFDSSDPSSGPRDKLGRPAVDQRLKRKSIESLLHPKRRSTATTTNNTDTDEGKKFDLRNKSSQTEKAQCGRRRRESDDVKPEPSCLRTEIMYLPNDVSSSHAQDSPCPDEEVLVPNWRLHPVTSCYQMEGTENLDDEVFLKRHQKLEIDERRRKRWDIQRIREQRQNEKLKRGRCENSEQNATQDGEMHSFCPNPEDALYLEVSDTVPVCAFGYPVPTFQPCEFSLPWLSAIDSNKDKPEKQDKQRNNSSCGSSPKKHRTSDGKRGS